MPFDLALGAVVGLLLAVRPVLWPGRWTYPPGYVRPTVPLTPLVDLREVEGA